MVDIMGLMDLFNQGDIREKILAAANKNPVPQGGVTGAAFNALFPHGLGNLAFGRQPQANPDLASPEGTQYMADLASNMMVPGTFIGPKGMSNLLGDDVARGLMSGAEAKLAQGVPREEVFRELGVFKGPEGKWRYEIDDSGAQFARRPAKNPTAAQESAWTDGKALLESIPEFRSSDEFRTFYDSNPGLYDRVREAEKAVRQYGDITRPAPIKAMKQEGPLDSFLMHDNMMAAYPDAAKIGTVYDPKKTGGSYNPAHDWMDIGGGNELSTTLHELQHAVQGREGFAAGGSPQGMLDNYASARARLAFLEKEPDFIAGKKKLDRLWDDVFEGKISEEQAALLEAEIIKQHPSHQQASEAMQMMRDNPAMSEAEAMSSYGRLAGEAEAREVQKRMGMGMDERRSIFPDYANRSDLIIRGLMSGGK